MLSTLSGKVLDAMNGAVIYHGYQQQPNDITQCFMGSTQPSDGSTIQYLSVLKTKIHES